MTHSKECQPTGFWVSGFILLLLFFTEAPWRWCAWNISVVHCVHGHWDRSTGHIPPPPQAGFLSRLVMLLFSHPVVSDPFLPHGLNRLPCPWDSPGKNTGLGSHFLLQGIFLTQGLNPHLLRRQAGSLPVSHLGSPIIPQQLFRVVSHSRLKSLIFKTHHLRVWPLFSVSTASLVGSTCSLT